MKVLGNSRGWATIRWLLLALTAIWTASMSGQTTATVTPITYARPAVGMLQAADKNFYAPSLPIFETCATDATHVCSYIYKVTPNGIPSIFFSFSPIDLSTGPSPTNDYGIEPTALIVGIDGSLYGTCFAGGPGGFGTIFRVDLNGKPTLLKSFGVTNNVTDAGAYPQSLIQAADGTFYFTNYQGVYHLTVSGTTGTVSPVYQFPFANNLYPNGANPSSILQGDDGNFYLTLLTAPQSVQADGTQGALAQLTPSGGFAILHTFDPSGSEGQHPLGPLTEGPDKKFYGVTPWSTSATAHLGTAYAVTGAGGFSVIHPFTDYVGTYNSALTLGSDWNFYGTTLGGGDTSAAACQPVGCGTLYQMALDGTLKTLHTFEGGAVDSSNPPLPPPVDGASPSMPLLQTGDGSFYGTSMGNAASNGIVYHATLSPAIPSPIQLTFNPAKVIPGDPTTLTWIVSNAFSMTAQVCSASIVGSPAGAGTWTGVQKGSMLGGVFSGSATITPTANGLFTYALTCGGRETGFATLSAKDDSQLQIAQPTDSSLKATVQQQYQLIMNAVGGVEAYDWSVSGTLPDGISFDTGTGTFFGIPQQFGSYPLVVTVKDHSPNPLEQSRSITITVASGLDLVNNLANGAVGAKYNGSLAASTTGGLPPYTWKVTGGALPAGLQLDSITGAINGTPTKQGSNPFTVTVSDDENPAATLQVAFNIAIAGPLGVVTGSPLPPAEVGVPYNIPLQASGGTLPYHWSFGANGPGSVPDSMTLADDGTFSGTPTQYSVPEGSRNTFNVVVSDSSNPKMTSSASLAIAVQSTLQITVSSLPNGTVGVVTNVPLTAQGGVPPYTWSVSVTPDANLGLTIVNNNTLQYLPAVALNAFVTLTVVDSERIPATVQVSLPLTTVSAQLPTTTTLSSSNSVAGTGENVTLTAQVAQAGGGIPTGQVIFADATATLGTVALDANGKAALQTSFAATGVYSVTASYSGSPVSAASVSTPLTETVVTPAVTAAVNPTTLTVKSGKTGQLIITVTPTGGYIGAITFSCGTLPAHVSCAFAPPTLTVNGTGPFTDTLTVTTNAPLVTALLEPAAKETGGAIFVAAMFWLPGSLAAIIGLGRRKGKRSEWRGSFFWTIAILVLIGVGAISGCAGSLKFAKPGTYTIPISLTLSGGSTQTVNATVVVD